MCSSHALFLYRQISKYFPFERTLIHDLMFHVRKKLRIPRRSKKDREENNANVLDLSSQSNVLQFKKICTTNSPFADTATQATYDWKKVLPLGKYSTHHGKYQRRRELASLKSIARHHVAINCRHLEIEYFDAVPFVEWKKIWEQILFLNFDSPKIFDLFALVFGRAGKSLHCHRVITRNDAKADPKAEKLELVRSDTIEALTMLSKNHRVENVFSNLYVPEFVPYVNTLMYKPFVVIDITSSSNFSDKDSYLRLLSLNNLLALSFSDNDIIDDSFLSCIFTCVANEGKLTELRVLVIRNCRKITPKGLTQFLAAISRHSCESKASLALVETDLELPVNSEPNSSFLHTNSSKQVIVEGTNWFTLNEPWRKKILSELPLVQKVKCLLKNYSEHINPLQLTDNILTEIKSRVILDLMIHKRAIDQAGLDYSALLETWINRLDRIRTSSYKNTFCYIIDKNKPIRCSGNEDHTTHTKKGIIFRASDWHQTHRSTSRRKKPQSLKKDYQEFFNL